MAGMFSGWHTSQLAIYTLLIVEAVLGARLMALWMVGNSHLHPALLHWVQSAGYVLEWPVHWVVRHLPLLHNPWFPHLELLGPTHSSATLSIVTLVAMVSYWGAFQYMSPSMSTLLKLLDNLIDEIQLYLNHRTSLELEKRVLELKLVSVSNEKHLLQLSVFMDELTHVYNKRFFVSSLDSLYDDQRRQSGSLALTMFDLDYFKQVNDVYGHLFGDEVLKQVALTLQQVAGPSGYCCRFGGEEFCLLMPAISQEASIVLVKKIQHAISELTFSEFPEVKVTVSAGHAHLSFSDNPQEIPPLELLKLADEQLYKAKEGGRNILFVYGIPEPVA
jgi:diguanylate cyclase (GGDEF)-like protein